MRGLAPTAIGGSGTPAVAALAAKLLWAMAALIGFNVVAMVVVTVLVAVFAGETLRDERADVLLVYDENGNYGHPDHVQVHRVGFEAARLVGLETVYQATVDREYLHFVETHLVEHAHDPTVGPPTIGVASVMVTPCLTRAPATPTPWSSGSAATSGTPSRSATS